MFQIPMLGNKQLDAEHRDLLMFAEQIKDDKDNVGKIVLYLLDEIQYHFFHEETFMSVMHYPHPFVTQHIEEHKRLREWFLNGVISLQREIENKQEVDDKIQAFFDALIMHFETYDRILSEWLKEVKK